MTIIPAIDMLGGQIVRLVHGDYENVTIYEKDPVSVAREFEQAGATRIHLVDLDAARGVRRENRKKIRRIRKAVKCRLQVGGGIRTDDDIEEYMDLGIDRLVVGTVFVRRPGLVEGWSAHYGDVFLAGIDAEDGSVRISGWQQETNISDLELAKRAKEVRCSGIVYTSIGRDGTLSGPDIERTNAVAEAARLPVIASGGIGSREDIDKLASSANQNVVGVIVGKAIYEEKINLTELYKDYPQQEKVEMTW